MGTGDYTTPDTIKFFFIATDCFEVLIYRDLNTVYIETILIQYYVVLLLQSL